MYLPDSFADTTEAEIAALIDAAPLACVIARTDGGLVANHLPLILQKGALIGHVARANAMHHLPPDTQVLAVFQGSDAYVSANDYPSKAETHRAVPTWNYQIVHVHGRIRFQDDPQSARAAVGLLTARMERRVHGSAGWRMADAPRDYMDMMLANIVAFRVEIDRIAAKSKLSQNKTETDRAGVVMGLDARGEADMAALVRDR
jgi:transcriptional regulator